MVALTLIDTLWWAVALISAAVSYFLALGIARRDIWAFKRVWIDALLVIIVALVLAWLVRILLWPSLQHAAQLQYVHAQTAGGFVTWNLDHTRSTTLLSAEKKRRLLMAIFYAKALGGSYGSMFLSGAIVGLAAALFRIAGSTAMDKPKEIENGTVIADGAPLQRKAAAKMARVKRALEARTA